MSSLLILHTCSPVTLAEDWISGTDAMRDSTLRFPEI
jgi:hypothetical protein